MKKLLLALALLFAPSLAFAQCTGVFPPNTLCGNLGATPAPPSAFSASTSIVGPGTSVIGHFATWANTAGSQLADFDLFGTANTFTAGQAFSGINTFSNSNTFSGANTLSNTNTFSSTVKFTGLSAGTQTKCLGLDSSNNVVPLTGACNSPSNADSVTNCSLAAAVAANALTISLKDASGADPSVSSPCQVSFRSATASTGSFTTVTVTAATSFSTGTTGSTFGSTNSVPFRLWITAWNNAGTLVLGVSNQSTPTAISPLNESAVQSSTACSACTNATSAGVYYTTATQTSKAIRILGYMDWGSGLATAGTWASGPTAIQLFGIGIKKPGEVVQTVAPALGTLTVVTFSGTPTSSNVTASITPTSAINLVKYFSATTAANNTGGNGVGVQMYRGSTAIGAILRISASSTSTQFSTTMVGVDAPASTSAQTYVVKGATITGGTGSIPAVNTDSGTLVLDEIMG